MANISKNAEFGFFCENIECERVGLRLLCIFANFRGTEKSNLKLKWERKITLTTIGKTA